MAPETRMSSKGQIVIAKEIRNALGLKPNQRFVEEIREGKIILKPVPSLAALGGSLRKVAAGRSVDTISTWIDKGWD